MWLECQGQGPQETFKDLPGHWAFFLWDRGVHKVCQQGRNGWEGGGGEHLEGKEGALGSFDFVDAKEPQGQDGGKQLN